MITCCSSGMAHLGLRRVHLNPNTAWAGRTLVGRQNLLIGWTQLLASA